MARNAEIGLLGSRLEKIATELDGVRKELELQNDERRQARQVRVFALLIFVSHVSCCQETIALYEGRLSAPDSRRYEMEDRIIALEEKLRKAATPHLHLTLRRSALPRLLRSTMKRFESKFDTFRESSR